MDKLPPLLLTRRMTAERLSCSIDLVKNLEDAGRLTRYRRNGGDTGPVLHDPRQVQAIADEILGKVASSRLLRGPRHDEKH